MLQHDMFCTAMLSSNANAVHRTLAVAPSVTMQMYFGGFGIMECVRSHIRVDALWSRC